MKKILVVGQSDNPGGVEAVIKRYYEALKHDIQIDLIVSTSTCYDEAYYRAHQSNIYFVKNAQFRHPLAYKKEIKSFFVANQGKYDAIWCNCCDLANCGYIMKMAKAVGIKKRIIHAHNNRLMQTGKRRYFYALMHHYWKNHIHQYATDFWACSEVAGEFFYPHEILQSKSYKIINNAIEINQYEFHQEVRDKIREKYHLNGHHVIGHVGRFQYQKNHEFLIDIFQEYLKLDSCAVLMLVGQGEEEERIRQKVSDKGIEKQVLFMGARDDVNEMLQAMDVFVLPSRFEGLGIVLIEAQAAGLACVTSKDVVPDVVNITGNVAFISLDAPIEQWVSAINEQIKKDVRMSEIEEELTKAGYNMTSAAEKFMKFLDD